MMKTKIYRFQIMLMAWMIGMACLSCDRFFISDKSLVLDEEDHYSEIGEVKTAFLGIMATFRDAAEHNILISELMGDLTYPTDEAPQEVWEVFRYSATNGNDWVDPAPFYKIVLNCNDFLQHLVVFQRENPTIFAANEYKGMISVAVGYRTWAYLTLGKIYGEAVYYDALLDNPEQGATGRLLSLDELIRVLIDDMNNGVDGVNGFQTLPWTTFISSSATWLYWQMLTVNPHALTSELYLWNRDYELAAQKALDAVILANGYTSNKVYYKMEETFATSSWKKLFTGSYETVFAESFTVAPFEKSTTFEQVNHLQYYFSGDYPNVYYIRPNDLLVSKYQSQGDIHRGEDVTFKVGTKGREICKYSVERKSNDHDAFIHIYRAADVFLLLAEALAHNEELAAADSLLNYGVKPSWDYSNFAQPFSAPKYTAGSYCLANCRGVRGRVNLDRKMLSDHAGEDATQSRRVAVLDSLIAEEAGRECAYEGKRWFTLLRMARNLGDPDFLAKQACLKFAEGEREHYRELLADSRNWFIRYDHTR